MKEDLEKIKPVAIFGAIGGLLLWVLTIVGESPTATPVLDKPFFSYVFGLLFYVVLGAGAGLLGVLFLAKTDLEKYRLHAIGLSVACGLSWGVIYTGTTELVKTTFGNQERKGVQQGADKLAEASKSELSPEEVGKAAKAVYSKAELAQIPQNREIAHNSVVKAIGRVEKSAEKNPVKAAESLFKLAEAAKLANDQDAYRVSRKAFESLKIDPELQIAPEVLLKLAPKFEALENY